MARKLTILGVLAALVLGVVSFAQQNSADAAIQSFCTGTPSGPCSGGNTPVNVLNCYGQPGVAPSSLTACPAGTSPNSIATPGAAVNVWSVIDYPQGTRLSLPATYTPGDWGLASGTPTCTIDAGPPPVNNCTGANQTGDVSAQTDLLCNGGALDILSTSATAQGAYPGTWQPFIVYRTWDTVSGPPPAGNENAYVLQISPFPSSFAFRAIDKAQLTQLWLNGTFPLALPNGGTPLQNLSMVSSYKAGLGASIALLGGNPNPPDDSYLCLSGQQTSVSLNNQLIAPAAAGYYPRWTLLQSDSDIVDGSVVRVLQTNCVTVGTPTQPDADGDCLADNVDPNPANADSDGDLVPDGVEVAAGSSPTAADADADGANDFTEMFQATNPNVADTDGDGRGDAQDKLAGFNATPPNYGAAATVDNCPNEANATQANSDSLPDKTLTPALGATDVTNPHQDQQGDACDTDDDNDGMPDVAEASFALVSPAPPATQLICKPKNTAGTVNTSTDPLNSDSDADGGLDGRECQMHSDPTLATKRFPNALTGEDPDSDGLFAPSSPAGGGAAETFYRTQGIKKSDGTLNDNPDGDTNLTGATDADSDSDGVTDGVEVKFYGTNPSNPDTDGDGCSDGKEIADINGSRTVSSVDLGQVASRTGNYRTAGGTLDAFKRNYDTNRDGNINSVDLGFVAKLIGNCPAQNGTGVGLNPTNSAK
ncbi:MAG: hypothetical protein HYX50_05740 [Chloroflexi bacterium]|nr:hypothetical protein [Chloroflexota bacterium]